jgi:hypothetical protein
VLELPRLIDPTSPATRRFILEMRAHLEGWTTTHDRWIEPTGPEASAGPTDPPRRRASSRGGDTAPSWEGLGIEP